MIDTSEFERLFKESLPFFNALGDPVRQNLMLKMSKGDRLSVKELTVGTQLSRPAISHHLKVLKQAQLIVEHKVGREIYYQPQPGDYFNVVKELMDMIDEAMKQKDKETK